MVIQVLVRDDIRLLRENGTERSEMNAALVDKVKTTQRVPASGLRGVKTNGPGHYWRGGVSTMDLVR